MATKKTTAKKVATEEGVVKVSGSPVINSLVTAAIVRPRITEKATQVAEQNVYTFNIATTATKTQVKEAVQKLYKVTPLKVNVVKIRARKVFVRGKRGVTAGGRKAYVYLKKGDKIELM